MKELFLNTGETASFAYDDGGVPIAITLKGPSAEERTRRKGTDGFYLFEIALEPPSDVRGMFESMAGGKMPPGSKDAVEGVPTSSGGGRTFPQVAPDGSIRPDSAPPEELLPEAYHKFVSTEITGRGRRFLLNTIGVVRWRFAEPGPHNAIVTDESSYSLDGVTWHRMPSGLYFEFASRSALRISDERRDEIQGIVAQRGSEPLGHELFREAWENRGSNNRSALILGVAAAEAAVKQCITRLVPDAGWLVETGPSPGLVDMLKNYLPKLPAAAKIRNDVPILPKAVRSVLDDAVKQRNKLVHVGLGQPDADEVLAVLLAVWDVLWLCDFYAGYPWALRYLSPQTRMGLGLEKGEDYRWVSLAE